MFASELFPLTVFVVILVFGMVVSRLCDPDRHGEWTESK